MSGNSTASARTRNKAISSQPREEKESESGTTEKDTEVTEEKVEESLQDAAVVVFLCDLRGAHFDSNEPSV